MRKLALAVAGLLLVSVVPTLAGAAIDVKEFHGSIQLDDDDQVVNPLSFKPTDDRLLENLYDSTCRDNPQLATVCDTVGDDIEDVPDGHDDEDDDGAPTWLYIRGQDKEAYNVGVTSEGNVVGTIDVYKYYPEGDANTPECSTELVTEVYPDGSIVSVGYLTKLRQVTIGSHGVTAAGANAPVVSPHLSLPPSQTGYVVVIDARAGTGAVEGAELNYGVTTEEALFSVNHLDNHWIQEPRTVANSVDPCLRQGVPIPDLDSTLGTSLPGIGQAIDIQGLLGTSLPEA